MKFGDYLKQKREEKEWTQPEASSAAGIEQSYLSKLETGKSWPSEDVFARLTTAYGIDIDDMARRVASSELARLREIGAVRAAVLDIQNGQRLASRVWLVACLLSLVVSGASFGLMNMASERDSEVTYDYFSPGVIAEGEPLEVFDIVGNDRLDPAQPDYAELNAQRQKMLARLDVNRITRQNLGPFWISKVDGGLRKYSFVASNEQMTRPPLRWFFVPALAFLAAAFGCAFISFRWR